MSEMLKNVEVDMSPENLEYLYRRRKLEIRSDTSLAWEKKELAIKALGDEYHEYHARLSRLEDTHGDSTAA